MDTTITTLEFCAGYGGIGLGLKNIFGERLRCLAYCELEGFAQANLISKMEKGLLDVAPLWNDLKTFPYGKFHGLVDILIAGYPCQPFSAAGKRAGKEDPRHLWPWIADGIRILRPRVCFFENVEGHISLGLSSVISDLEELGYKVSWGIFSAREVGAPHQRKRVFILAYDKSQRIQGHWADWLQESRPHAGQGLPLRGGDAGCCELADACHGSNPAHGYAEAHRLPSEHWQEVCSWVAGGTNATAWPSRPGQPQHGWEPPRVVGSVPAKLANFCSRDAQQGGNPAQTSGEGFGAWGESADAMPDGGSSVCRGDTGDESQARVVDNDHRPHAGHGEQRPQRELGDLSGGCGEGRGKLGDSTHQRDFNETQQDHSEAGADTDRASEGAGEDVANSVRSRGEEPEHLNANLPTEPSRGDTEGLGNSSSERPCGGTQDGLGQQSEMFGERHETVGDCDSLNRSASPERWQHDSDGGEDADGQAQPSLGRDSNGPSSRLGYAELHVTCDNRTDELRLLGNGVVPATAERAFRTLIKELL